MPKRKIWVPGVAFVDRQGRLDVGRHVGYSNGAPDFRLCPVGGARSIRDWSHTVWLAPRAALTEETVTEHAIVLAEGLLDVEKQPHAHRWLLEQPLVAVSPSKWDGLCEAGVRMYRVSFGVVEDNWIELEAAGGGRDGWTVAGDIDDFLPKDTDSPLPKEQSWAYLTLVDRLLAQASRGALREASVANALRARLLIEPGYGYHGQQFGSLASVARVQRAVRGVDHLFKQVFQRAAAQEAQARDVRARLKPKPSAKSADFDLKPHGPVRPRRLNEYDVDAQSGEVSYMVSGEPQEVFAFDALEIWITKAMTDGDPSLSPELREELEATQGERRRAVSLSLAIGALVALVVVALILYSQVR